MTDKDTPPLTRRTLLKSSLAGALALTAKPSTTSAAPNAPYPASAPAPTYDFTQNSSALQPDKVINSACQFCNSNCRLKVSIKANRVIDIAGEPADPVQLGALCVKGPMMAQILYSPHRLTHPLKRTAGEKGSPDSTFAPITWEEALTIIAKKFLALRDAGEPHAIANKTSGRLPRGTGSLVNRFFTLLGSPNDTDVGPVCNDAGGDALAITLGLGNFTNGYGIDPATNSEDLGSAKLFLFLGTNQAETHPVTFAHLLRCREKTKAKLIVIDPRLTPTSAQADQWIAPKPHTDLALTLALLHHITTQNLHDQNFVNKWVLGFNELKQHLIDNNYTPEWAEKITDIPAATIKQIAHDYATTKPAAIFCNAGISHQLSAFDTYRTLTFLAAITGNIGVPGAGCNFMHNTWPGDLHLPPITQPTPKKSDALPVGPDYFAESILTSKPYQLKAIMTCGNPLLASANSKKVAEAYKKLDFYIYTGLFMEESAYYADIILPACSGLEMETVYSRRDDRAIRWQNQAVPPIGECKPDWQIWIDLAHTMAKLDTKNPPEYWTAPFPQEWKDYKNLWAQFVAHTPGMAGMTQARLDSRTEPLRWPCPTLDHPGVSTLYLDHPTWYQAAESLNPNNKNKRFLTPSGKIEIFTPEIQARLSPSGHAALPTFYSHPEVTGNLPTLTYSADLIQNPINPNSLTPKIKISTPLPTDLHKNFPLMAIIGRPSVVHFSSVTQWTQTGKQLNGIRLIQIHPNTAKLNNIQNGAPITITSPRGSIQGTAELTPGIREDTIFIPNTFGPMQKVATESGTPLYTSANTLLNDQLYDTLSGQQPYKCLACKIQPT